MKHQTLDQLQAIAEVNASVPAPRMTRTQRLQRWADLLGENPSRCLAALTGTEHMRASVRQEARAAGSPITVAFEDSLLRACGLSNDSYGEAKRFFELSDWQLHDIVCSCHVGSTMQAGWVSARVRRILTGNRIAAWLRRQLWAH
ncbi:MULTISPECIES: hypothetical protein [unclassified Mesorhizobium]|uniref:hypothetical protein n=1 Tax=unclassified Mesorhizobium TaxID=325217 RepID=UPI000FC9F3A8|nr:MULTISPECIES: hypothetical protein [unclassified Mesorhizobium]RUX02034.1 hypothetical protein EOA35_15465 [Mesorhizobium sp. M8A.F.Ca.ET.023.01.1.1]RVD59694.1 hypothetical protein EN746_01870 [Mesorhizobium sp. M8A.F.Ca.ET.023.02.2.1]TGR58207.1 hypothetical protein EN842_01000 [bacterium M00.F.Ca.ET.199.01.1.1]TGU41685.1 hypothetical protein EN799_03815 [bacterium M00.F.Ca.ET.156.01.1.1]TGU93124.1 hypothetical protein EN794_032180 [Mesorhizobium sp. M00.F.Ca.ET.151.01.1.1]TGV15988.1 hypot